MDTHEKWGYYKNVSFQEQRLGSYVYTIMPGNMEKFLHYMNVAGLNQS